MPTTLSQDWKYWKRVHREFIFHTYDPLFSARSMFHTYFAGSPGNGGDNYIDPHVRDWEWGAVWSYHNHLVSLSSQFTSL